MTANGNTTAVLDKYLANSMENLCVPQDVDQELLCEFVDSTMSGLEKLEEIFLAFEAGQMAQDDCLTAARRILHNIKGEAGIMELAIISDVCHHAESLLYEDMETIPIDMLFSIKDWIAKAMQHLVKINSELSEYIFRTESMKILDSAEIDLFDLGHGTSDIQAVRSISFKMSKIAELAVQKPELEVKALAEKAMDLLGGIQKNERCIISEAHKDSLLDLLDAIKQRVLNGNKPA